MGMAGWGGALSLEGGLPLPIADGYSKTQVPGTGTGIKIKTGCPEPQGSRPAIFPGNPEHLWPAPPVQANAIKIIPGPGRVVLP